ncbi:MAG: peroxiredoxin [Verrucomicrobiota bacterium]
MHAAPLAVGSPAPQLTHVVDQEGKTIDLSSKFKSGWTLVYFYPKADTPGCTKEACSLRDNFSSLTSKGLTVYGVSTDKAESQKAFQEKYQLPFTLIADPDKQVANAFGVPADTGFAKRMSFLIHNGKVVWNNLAVDVPSHVSQIETFIQNNP